jgi:hypothetical protein
MYVLEAVRAVKYLPEQSSSEAAAKMISKEPPAGAKHPAQ